jgi:hypothetical protein
MSRFPLKAIPNSFPAFTTLFETLKLILLERKYKAFILLLFITLSSDVLFLVRSSYAFSGISPWKACQEKIVEEEAHRNCRT